MNATDLRLAALETWLHQLLPGQVQRVEVASADASFRRYFRATLGSGATRIVMDAPPDKEDIAPYLKVAGLLERTGVHVPHVHAADPTQGFVLLEDLGRAPYLDALRAPQQVDALYGDALAALVRIAVAGRALAAQLPPYDAAVLEREMQLMPEWFAAQHLRLRLDADEAALLRRSFDVLIAAALEQPVTFVHRDYHSRNLMIIPERNPGIIDFQDALRGPLAYDLVSLLKDCYIGWPRERVEAWVRQQHAALGAAGFEGLPREREFLRHFDLIGLQRHIKVLGIFARLWYRDGKIGYLGDLPLTLAYARDTAARYGELQPLARWLETRVAPLLAGANARELAPRPPPMACPA
jgi:aminoglycoside/choline kinase family phosphotransferase